MKQWRNFSVILFVVLLFSFGLRTSHTSASINTTIPLQAVNDATLIYYRLDPSDDCTDNSPISLGDFIKKTLPNEWIDQWANTPDGIEALKAGAVAIRTFTISAYHSEIVNVGGQNYYCAKAWRQAFDPNEVISNYPNSVVAVNATNGIILSHSTVSTYEATLGWPVNMRTGAINAQYRDDTGEYTNDGGHPWLKSVYDPISTGSPQTGMGQHGSRRWAWGEADSSQNFPKWDYRRILAHYYSEVEFVGVSPDPPEGYRSNMLQTSGFDPHDGLEMRKGEERTGFGILYQNTGQWVWPTNQANVWGGCTYSDPPFHTLLSYHLYPRNPDGTPGSNPVCTNCVGIRRTPMCVSDFIISSGEHHWINGFHIFIPDDPAIIVGQTYLLRFDVEHRNDSVWGGYPNFYWPSQNIPVYILPPPGSGGGDEPETIIDYPPAVVTYNDLVNGRYGFSWSGVNATTYDLQYRNKEIGQANYSTDFTTILSNSPATQFSGTVGCNEDRLDWQFRLRGRNSSEVGDWAYVESQTRVYPHPWFSYWSIVGLVLDSDPGPWPRSGNIINLGGGTFGWSATANQSWITVNSSGQGEGTLGIVLSKSGGSGDYVGTITVNTSNPQPTPNCNSQTTFQIPVTLMIRTTLETYYFPIIFKNSQ
jgi:hypothetical protein